METYTIPICILLVASMIVIAFGFISRSLNADRPSHGVTLLPIFGAMMMLVAPVLLLISIAPPFIAHSIEHETLDRSTYTYYLDGAEVSASTIDIDLYDYTYDDENQKVYLTHKTPEDNSGIGFGIGWIARGLWN